MKKEKEKKNRKKDKENGSGSGDAGNHNEIDAPDAVVSAFYPFVLCTDCDKVFVMDREVKLGQCFTEKKKIVLHELQVK